MTKRQMAQHRCMNWSGRGRCRGVTLTDAGALVRFRAEGVCTVETGCKHFDECVMPLVRQRLEEKEPQLRLAGG